VDLTFSLLDLTTYPIKAMALTQTFSYAGVTVSDGYLRVSNVFGTKEELGFILAYQAATGEIPLTTKEFSFAPEMDDNFIKQAYLYLKTLPEFSDAEDC
jgi:hypothetical protein